MRQNNDNNEKANLTSSRMCKNYKNCRRQLYTSTRKLRKKKLNILCKQKKKKKAGKKKAGVAKSNICFLKCLIKYVF